MSQEIPAVMVSLREIPEPGPAKVLVLMSLEDRELINEAARILSTSQQRFVRTVAIAAARQVKREIGAL